MGKQQRQGENVLKQTHKLDIATIVIQIKRNGPIPTEVAEQTIPECIGLIEEALAEADEAVRPIVANYWGGSEKASTEA